MTPHLSIINVRLFRRLETRSAGGDGIFGFCGVLARFRFLICLPFIPPQMNSNPAFASLLRIRIAVLLALAAGWVLVSDARAQTNVDWTGGTSVTWATGNNWSGGTAPTANITANIARFNQTSYSFAPTATSGGQIAGIIIGNGTTVTPTLMITTSTNTNRLKIGASGILMNANAGATTIGAATTQGLLVAADQSWTNNSANLLTISSFSNNVTTANYTVTINGAGTGGTSITNIISDNGTGKIGLVINTTNGTTTLAGVNTFTGGVTLNTGTLILGNNAALGGAAGNFTINGGVIDVNAVRSTTNNNAQKWNGDFTFNGTNTLNLGTGAVTMNASRIVTVNASTLTVGGVIQDGGSGFGLTKAGAGNLTLTGANTYTGATTINAGTLQIGAAGTTGNLSASSSITNNGTLAFNRTNTVTQGADFGNVISGTGNLIQAGSGNLILTGANTYNGSTTISAGTLQIGNGGTTGSLNANSAIINNGTLTFNRTGTITQGTDFASTISGTGNLTQAGSGTLILSGNNTYSGLTTVSAGTLTLSGNNTGAGGVVVNTGQLNINHINALGATAGNFSINAGATIDNTSNGAITGA
jgi:autotransporter-associated beta strand protein